MIKPLKRGQNQSASEKYAKTKLTPDSIIGIDPGIRGGICCLQGSEIIRLEKMPIVRGDGRKTEVDATELRELFKELKQHNPLIYLEKVGAMRKHGTRQSTVSMFSFGKSFGIVIGSAIALEIPLKFITPKEWRKITIKNEEEDTKKASIKAAKELFPDADLKPGRTVVDQDGLAEALLIAVAGGTKEW